MTRRQAADNPTIAPISFILNHHYRLTSLRVVPVSALATNKHPHALWDLVSESNSIPVNTFTYGQGIRGLHPVYKGSAPEPLEPDVAYRIIVEAGKEKSEHDFTPQAKAQ